MPVQSWQLKRSRRFSQVPGPGHATTPSTNPSKPIAPYRTEDNRRKGVSESGGRAGRYLSSGGRHRALKRNARPAQPSVRACFQEMPVTPCAVLYGSRHRPPRQASAQRLDPRASRARTSQSPGPTRRTPGGAAVPRDRARGRGELVPVAISPTPGDGAFRVLYGDGRRQGLLGFGGSTERRPARSHPGAGASAAGVGVGWV